MKIPVYFMFLVTIPKLKCQQVLNEELVISEQRAGEKVNINKSNIDRRFLEDLDDYEWHIAHLRGAVFDGRRDCMDDTFADKVRRYRKMLKNDAARVEFVSSDPIPVNPADITEDTCKVGGDDLLKDNFNETIKVTSAKFSTVTRDKGNVAPTTIAPNITASNTTASMRAADTTPKEDFKATTVKADIPPILKKKKKIDNDTVDQVRRASEYMFSSIEYYDESLEFDATVCPDAVEVIELELDQLRSYDLECELTLEWRSLE